MRLIRVLLACALASVAGAVDYPAVVEVDIVFPHNETYNNVTEMPIVIALQNAEVAFDWGFKLGWRLNLLDPNKRFHTTPGSTYARGDEDVPSDAVDNIWYYASRVRNTTVLEAGKYRLYWHLQTTTCSETERRITIYPLRTVASGFIVFTIVDDGSGKAPDLEEDTCPEFLDHIVVEGATGSGCPHPASKYDGEPEPCKAKLSSQMVDCFEKNSTAYHVESICPNIGGSSGDDHDEDAAAGMLPPVLVSSVVVMILVCSMLM